MELKEAIDNLIMLKYFTKVEKEENYKDYVEAINTVLEELDEKDQELYVLKASIRDLKGQYKDYPFIANVLENLE